MEKKTVLCVIDVQNDFITGSLANEEAQKKVPNIVEKINSMTTENCECILVTCDSHEVNYLESMEGNKLPVEHCIARTEGWLIEKSVMEALMNASKRGIDVKIFDKPTFGSRDMIDYIDDYIFIDDCVFELLGFCTDICVVSNAILLKTLVYDNAEVSVIADCCAGVTPETHDAALKTMSMCQINII